MSTDPARREEAVFVANGNDAVVQLWLPGRRIEILAHSLDQIWATGPAAEHRRLGVSHDDLDTRVLLFEIAGHAGDGAAGAGSGHEVGDAPGGLLPQFGPGALVVGQRIVGVGVLVGTKSVAFDGEPLRHAVVAGGVIRGHRHRAHHHFGPVGP